MSDRRNRLAIRIIGTASLLVSVAMAARGANQVAIPQGTVIELQTTSSLDSGTAQQGDTFSTTVRRPVYLPLGPVRVNLRKVRGRGQIRLLEQPTATNDYTAVVQVNDQAQQGSAWYEFTLDW